MRTIFTENAVVDLDRLLLVSPTDDPKKALIVFDNGTKALVPDAVRVALREALQRIPHEVRVAA